MKKAQKDVWSGILHRLESTVGEDRFNLWFRNIEPITFSEGTLEIGVPNLFIGEWLEKHFGDVIIEAARHEIPECKQVRFKVVAKLFKKVRETQLREFAGVAEENGFVSDHTAEIRSDMLLENFVVGPCNRFAHAAAMEIINSTSTKFNPLFLHGGVGLGKTHILQGIWNSLQKRRSKRKAIYVSAERFANEYVFALRHHKLDSFRHFYRNIDVLLIDDVHFLRNKMGFQEEFFHTYNSLDSANKQVVMASDTHPKLIGKFKEALINRFVSGMVIKLEPPDFKTRVAILRTKAKQLRKVINPDVLRYIADTVTGNVRELEGALTTVIAYASLSKSKITLSLAKQALEATSKNKRNDISIEKIEKTILKHFDVTRAQLHSSRRTKSISYPRQIAMYLARKYTSLSTQEIADYFGGKNHTTVLFADRKVSRLREKDVELDALLKKLEQQITA